MEKLDPCTQLAKCKMVHMLWKTVWQFLKRLNIELSHNPAIPLLSIYPRELKVYVHTKTSTLLSTETFIHNSQNVETIQITINW